MLILLDDSHDRSDMEQRMAAYGRQFAWPLVGAQYVELFRRVLDGGALTDLLAVKPELPRV